MNGINVLILQKKKAKANFALKKQLFLSNLDNYI